MSIIQKNYRKIFSAIFIVAFSCHVHAQANAGLSLWMGKLKLNDSINLLFDFDYSGNNIIIHNAAERITVDEVVETKDSLNFKMPVFDSEFKCKKTSSSLSGVWINHARKTNNILQFTASKTHRRNEKIADAALPNPTFGGKWEVTFSPGTPDEYKGIGLFQYENNGSKHMTGTILTETGDYRYLEGEADKKGLTLSCFDGTHAFLFAAKLQADGTLNGDFYAGAHGHEKWIARHNDKFELRNADSLTFLKPGFDKLDFSFPDLSGKKVSLSDEKYKGKVVIVQIMGSWCPNCMDETKFMSGFYEKNKAKGLEIIGLAYERGGEMPKAVANVERFKKRLNCNYTVLIAGLSSDKNEAAKSLPAISSLMGYPTTIYIDKKGKVRKIYTGFYGPATGAYYDKYVEETNLFVKKLLSE